MLPILFAAAAFIWILALTIDPGANNGPLIDFLIRWYHKLHMAAVLPAVWMIVFLSADRLIAASVFAAVLACVLLVGRMLKADRPAT